MPKTHENAANPSESPSETLGTLGIFLNDLKDAPMGLWTKMVGSQVRPVRPVFCWLFYPSSRMLQLEKWDEHG